MSEAQQYYDALKRIAAGYMPSEELERRSKKLYGLEPSEAIEMAYDNVLAEVKAVIRGKRRPK